MSNGRKNYKNYPNPEIPMEDFYKDTEKKILNTKLLDSVAFEIAKILNKGNLSTTQIRRYYNEIKTLEKIFILKNENWEEIEPFVKMVKSKAYYGKDKIGNLSKFLKIYIDKIEDGKDFKAFCKLFEAVIGYFYGIAKN